MDKDFIERQKLAEQMERDELEKKRDDAVRRVTGESETVGSGKKLTCEDLLNVDDFEKYIAVNTSKEDLKAIFLATDVDLDKFTRREYGLDFKTAYTLLLRRALAEYKSCLSGLACNGNATAMNTINQLTLDMSNDKEVRIKVVGAVPVEVDD